MTRKPSTTSADVLALLERHYLPDPTRPAGVFAPEIQAPVGSRRADLIWMGCTTAGRDLVGHEVKVTRADVLAELADLTKADAWQRYCDRWWLVVPHVSLIDGLEIPDTWGVMGPPSGRRTRSMTVHRPAPRLAPADQGPALRTVATWLHWRHHRLTEAADTTRREVDHLRVSNADLRRRVAPEPAGQAREDAIVREVLRRLGGAQSNNPEVIGDWDTRVSVDDVVAALVDLGSVYRTAARVADEAGYTIDQLAALRRRLAADGASVDGQRLRQAVDRLRGRAPGAAVDT